LARKDCTELVGTLTAEGLIETSGNTAKFAVAVPPPGAGFTTATGKVPTVARSADVKPIVSCVALTKVAVWLLPLKVTVEEGRKPVPLIVSSWDVDPTGKEVGTSGRVIVGTGLFTLIDVELVSGFEELPCTIAGSVAEIGNGPPGVPGARYCTDIPVEELSDPVVVPPLNVHWICGFKMFAVFAVNVSDWSTRTVGFRGEIFKVT
jgi:hypothetical protein